MSEKQVSSAAPGLTVSDVLFVVFRHKWKIISISILGLITAVVLFKKMPFPYQSEAKLFIKYVVETKSLPQAAGGNEPRIKSADERGENIINTEIEILTSLDLASNVAAVIGPEKILGAKDATNVSLAALDIRKNLTIEVPKRSNVIRVAYEHPDRSIVQRVLQEIINTYLIKHHELNRPYALPDDVLVRETDQIHSRLVQLERDLRNATAKAGAGVISLEDSKKLYSEQISKIRQSILDAQAELAERQTAVGELNKLVPGKTFPGTNETQTGAAPTTPVAADKLQQYSNVNRELENLNASEQDLLHQGYREAHPLVQKVRGQLRNLSAQKAELERTYPALKRMTAAGATNSIDSASGLIAGNNQPSGGVSAQKLMDYNRVCGLLENLAKREQDLLVTFTPENSYVKQVRQQIAANEKLKQQLEEENPALLSMRVSDPKAAGNDPGITARNELASEKTRVSALQAKLKVLTEQLDSLRKEANALYEAEDSITELQRKKQLEEAQYKYFSESLANARIDEQLSAGKVPNISKIEEPSPPFKEPQKRRKFYEMLAMIVLGSFGGAVGLAFFIELFLDRSLKRPVEVEAKLGLPLYLSIPLFNLNGNTRSLSAGRKQALLSEVASQGSEAGNDGRRQVAYEAELAPWDPRHILRPFSDALRDRLITFFEVSGLTHKPKLVAVTSCGKGSGVSTVAAGLAASLSETGDGNVLLVDMNEHSNATHEFYRGELACGLDDALEMTRRDNALVQENLYVVTEKGNNDKLSNALPKRFRALVPKLKASDYDYVIFDMPPVSQISITPRLARFMDMVFMVVESEKTDRDVVKRATAMLAETKTNVGVILNKGRNYVPRRLEQQL
jgi:uncharacterized protein involved in exopolysaccharide biosynthesis/Mrp family chromosome partitioning ATPase